MVVVVVVVVGVSGECGNKTTSAPSWGWGGAGAELGNDRESKKGSSNQWWKKSLKSSYTTVIFVPPTPNGVLMKMMRNREKSLNENSKMKIKFIEKGSLFPRPWSPNKAAFFLLL